MKRIFVLCLVFVLFFSCGLADEFAASANFNDFQIGFEKYWEANMPKSSVEKADLITNLAAKSVDDYQGKAIGYDYFINLAEVNTTKYYLVEIDKENPVKGLMGTYYGYVVVSFFDGQDFLQRPAVFSSVSINVRDFKGIEDIDNEPTLNYYVDVSEKGLVLDGFGFYRKNKKDDYVGYVESVNLEGYAFKLEKPEE